MSATPSKQRLTWRREITGVDNRDLIPLPLDGGRAFIRDHDGTERVVEVPDYWMTRTEARELAEREGYELVEEDSQP